MKHALGALFKNHHWMTTPKVIQAIWQMTGEVVTDLPVPGMVCIKPGCDVVWEPHMSTRDIGWCKGRG